MKPTAIIQARVGSTRLPGKVLLKVMDKTILEHVIERVKKAKNIDDIIIATTIKKEDLKIVKLASRLGISIYCGSEEDVLDRYYQAARLFNVKCIARITADCPLIDPKVVDNVISVYIKNFPKYDYVSNTINPTYPDGQDTEVFSFEALKQAWGNAKKSFEREHVTPYISRSGKFNVFNVQNEKDYSYLRWVLDEERDLVFIREVYDRLFKGDDMFYMEDVLRLYEEDPSIAEINKDLVRNEKLQKQIENEG